jgi:hypothetical protein
MAKTNFTEGFKTRLGSITKIKSQKGEPVKMETGQTIINKKATANNLKRLVEINNDSSKKTSAKETNDGTMGGLLEGPAHYDKNGKPLGGIKVIVDNNKEIEVEGKEFAINEQASKKHWAELSKINQSAGNGVPINPPNDVDEDPEEFKEGGRVIDFNPNRVPSKMILNYAKKIKKNYPEVWDLGGNIFGNEAFENLKRVSERGYWLDSEEWMYIKWRSYVARHIHDFRIEGVIAMLKWVDKVERGWPYMKNLIEAEIEKRTDKKSKGGPVTYKNKYNKKYDYEKNESHDLKEISEDTGVSIKGLQQIYNKGIGAYKTNPKSVRPNVKSKEQWATARVYSAIMGGKAAKVDAKELKMEKGGGINDCIYFIKNSEAIKNNGYYLEFKNLSIYIGSGDKVVPKIKSIFLITYNSGGQKNLKPIDTINSMELANKLANLLNVEIGVARIIVSEQVTHSKRFEINKINSIVNKNIIIADRDTIVCTNLPMKLSNGGLIAPNGKASNLTPDQYKLVRTPQFKAWFGDWENDPQNASKIVDENGEPKVMYRGNPKEQGDLGYKFNTGYNFLNKKSNNNFGFFFTDDINVAKKYMKVSIWGEIQGGSITEVFLNVKNVFDITPLDYFSEGDTFSNYLTSNNLNFLGYEKLIKRITDYKYYEHKEQPNIYGFFDRFPRLRNFFIFNKIDGIVFLEKSRTYLPYLTYVVWESNQIKLADGTNTTFDQDNPDIRFDEGGELDNSKAHSNTSKLIEELKKYSVKTTSDVMKNAYGETYVYHYYKLKYPHASNWLVRLFEKASEEITRKNYHRNFANGDYSFYYDRPELKNRPNGTIQMKQLEVLKMMDGGNIDKPDSITVDVPLMIRLLESAREDIKSDPELHFVVENLIKLKDKKTLTMDDYAYIVNVKKKHLNNLK